MDLNGKRVLVTGASRGIGAQMARDFAEAGARVALVARSKEPLEALAEELDAEAYPADLTDRGESHVLIDRVTDDGPIDVLVNNAGVDVTGNFAETDPKAIDDLLELNLHVPMQLCHDALSAMIARGHGHIVNISSLAGTVCGPGLTTYTTSKAGLSHFTGGLRAETKGLGIGITLVEIGPVATEMIDSLREYAPTKRALGRFETLRLLYDLNPERVSRATVDAVRHNRRHVRLPRRSSAFPILAELPRRLTEVILTGVDHHTR